MESNCEYPNDYSRNISQAQEEWQMDDFDRRLLCAPLRTSHPFEGATSATRMTLPKATSTPMLPPSYDQSPHFTTARNAFAKQYAGRSSDPTTPILPSSPSHEGFPSSPTFLATQNHHKKRKTIHDAQTPSYPSLEPDMRGVKLHSPRELPDRMKAIFPFETFNAVQSRCFPTAFESDNNLVLSSPTGSGKTAVFELAICRLLLRWPTADFKIVYMSPTKALCAERASDWKKKFSRFELQAQEITGDSVNRSLQSIRSARLIVTTPEKWDSLTRRWKDHEKLVRLIRLVLIDEVHILGTDRGATLEAVVSRMKSIGSDIRIVAASATIPNPQDLATWIGMSSNNPQTPAIQERFGEDFRPVKLRRYVLGYDSGTNDFAFDAALTSKIPDVVQQYAKGKPVLVFCLTVQSCITTANHLADWYSSIRHQDKPWIVTGQPVHVLDHKLQVTLNSGVAFHHSRVESEDRNAVEAGYLDGRIKIICCTSTLATGVNLPCHMVIVKGTAAIDGFSATRELSEMDLLQMIGRAGRPQFDSDAVAVIMTRRRMAEKYERLVNCQEVLESRLHLNLLEHFNAEVGLGTVRDLPSATTWLSSTFLHVRLASNPDHYKQYDDLMRCTLDESLESICSRAVDLLHTNDLLDITSNVFRQSDAGAAMARYCISFETMKALVTIDPKPKLSELLTVMCNAYELKDIRFRAKEKQLFKQANESPALRFPFRVNIATGPQKTSLILQTVLGGIDVLAHDPAYSFTFKQESNKVFQACRRLIRCIVDCQVARGDATGIRNALMLVRSIGAEVWDDLPRYIQQLTGVGPVSVRKLAMANITSLDKILTSSPAKIEMAMGRGPPCGMNLIQQAKTFPRLRLHAQQIGKAALKHGQPPVVQVKATISFENASPPVQFNNQFIVVTFLAGSSDGRKLDFVTMGASKIIPSLDRIFHASLTAPRQLIHCSVGCEEIAGTQAELTLDPDVPLSAFHNMARSNDSVRATVVPLARPNKSTALPRLAGDGAKVRTRNYSGQTRASSTSWDDDNIADNDLVAAEVDNQFHNIDDIPLDAPISRDKDQKKYRRDQESHTNPSAPDISKPVQLENGRWQCNHHCKDRQACNHKCCTEGLKKPPRAPKVREQKSKDRSDKEAAKPAATKAQTTIISKQGRRLAVGSNDDLEQVDLTQRTSSDMAAVSRTQPEQTSKPQASQIRHPTTEGRHASRADKDSVVPMTHRRDSVDYFASDDMSDVQQSDDEEFGLGKHGFDSGLPTTASLARPCDRTFASSRPPAVDLEDDEVLDEEMLEAALIGAEDSCLLSNRLRPRPGPEKFLLVDQQMSHRNSPDDERRNSHAHDHHTKGMDGENARCAAVQTGLQETVSGSNTKKVSADEAELRDFLKQEFGDIVELV